MPFTAVFVLLALREQTFALVALCVLGIGTALTGFFPSVIGLYATTVLMSLGFHYFETIRQSLALQWVDKASAPHFLGQMIAVGSIASLAAFALIYLALDVGGLDMRWVYVLGGGATVGITLAAWVVFPASAPRSSSTSTWCCAGAIGFRAPLKMLLFRASSI